MNSEVLKELLKLYPKVKIPVESLTEFYVDTLIKHPSYSFLKDKIEQLETFYEKQGSITEYKFGIANKLKEFFDSNIHEDNTISCNKIINEFVAPEFTYSKKQFNDYKENHFYISIDLSEANYNVYRKYSGLHHWFFMNKSDDELRKGTWNYWLRNEWNVDICLSESKSFRQFVLGNTNPKKIARLQEYEMSKIVTKLLDGVVNESDLVATSSDEIIIELPINFCKEVINHITNLQFDSPVKYTIFKMSGIKNLGEHVKIKTIYDKFLNEINKELFGVSGTRFFMHFRTLMLNEELQENDLLYMNDGFKSKWII